jgi:hypothetical protein
MFPVLFSHFPGQQIHLSNINTTTLLSSDDEYIEEQSTRESETLATVELEKRNSKCCSVANGS